MLGCSCLCPSHHSAAATRSGRPPVPVVRFSHLNERPAAAPPAPQSPACTTRAMLPCRTGRTSSPQSVLQPSRPCLTSSCSWLQSCRQRASTLRRPARCAYPGVTDPCIAWPSSALVGVELASLACSAVSASSPAGGTLACALHSDDMLQWRPTCCPGLLCTAPPNPSLQAGEGSLLCAAP